ncbi:MULTISPECIES: hypothetical protein [Nostocaceae]|uniref:hypothetical protein n=2 Tax=Nostocales TaxID=1161 RepID=UPI001683E0ED|nr:MULTISPECIES: hypothetical protein [Nostocaceae]MBD2476702.1 hypothetical protein [Anabaena sp. FACHB-83]
MIVESFVVFFMAFVGLRCRSTQPTEEATNGTIVLGCEKVFFLTNRKGRIDAIAASRRVGHKEGEEGKEREFHK